MSTLPRLITSDQFARALEDAGVIQAGDMIRRIVIDAQVNHAVKIYVERMGDERLLNVALALNGIEVTTWRGTLDADPGREVV